MPDEPTIIGQKELEYAVLTNKDGEIIFNCAQVDVTVIRRQWSDGKYDIIRKDNGKIILDRYDPYGDGTPPCRHCGKEPYTS